MQKKSKRVFAAVVAVLMVLSVGYFALLAPTTAWFYEAWEQTHTFTFGDFDVEEVTEVIEDRILLRAATRFADLGEDLFDEVAHVVEVDVTNEGELDAVVNVNVLQNEEPLDVSTSELKWFITDTLPTENAEGEYVTANKGVYKTAIEDMLTEAGVTLVKYGSLARSTAETAYETYNDTAIEKLVEHNAEPISVPGNDSTAKKVYVVFWVEYGTVKDAFAPTNDVTHEYDVTIEFSAAPDPVYNNTPEITTVLETTSEPANT